MVNCLLVININGLRWTERQVYKTYGSNEVVAVVETFARVRVLDNISRVEGLDTSHDGLATDSGSGVRDPHSIGRVVNSISTRARRVDKDTNTIRVVDLGRKADESRRLDRLVSLPRDPILCRAVLEVHRLSRTSSRLNISTRVCADNGRTGDGISATSGPDIVIGPSLP